MIGWKERGGANRFPQAWRGRKNQDTWERELEQTQNCRGDLPKCRQKRKAAHRRAAQRCLGQQDQWASQKVARQLS
ncbi:mCG147168 [Mus musculus]|nr:mCG147168 [Mus musculus]